MIAGIVGLGLIGGSAAKAYKKAGHQVYAYDIDERVQKLAVADGAVDEQLTDDLISLCDLILICVYPHDAVAWLTEKAPLINKNAMVIDACGIKQEVCSPCMSIAEEYGFCFVGGHPMAGTHTSGYSSARADMFSGASMVIVPPVFDDIVLLDRVKHMLEPLHLGKLKICTAKEHDEMIAYTSQMPHIVSNAFVKSPYYDKHLGFSGGSFRDMTRVAQLNESMWAELCLYNSEVLIEELDRLCENLQEYRSALHRRDTEKLRQLFREGSMIKKENA